MRLISLTAVLVALQGTPAICNSAADCEGCHGAEHATWNASLHARSADDVLYLAMRDWARRDAGEEAAAMCATCHTVAVKGSAERTPAVTCAACHLASNPGSGPQAWTIDPQAPVQAARTLEGAAHPVVASPRLASGDACLVCHGELHNPRGVPLCTTGPEHAEASGTATCLTCHMPDGDHSFPGATPQLLARAATLDLELGPGAREVHVTVVNRGTGHALPTGPVLRQVILEVRMMDAGGASLASHSELFARVLRDAEGNTPSPPWRAVAVAADTRLSAHERRVFDYAVPARTVVVEARLVYRRAPAMIGERLGLAGEPLLAPVQMTRVVRAIQASGALS